MKLIQISYSSPMIQAKRRKINPKSQTRRIRGLQVINQNPDLWSFVEMLHFSRQNFYCAKFKNNIDGRYLHFKSPYGQPGDILWTRETFQRLVNCKTNEFTRYAYYADWPEEFHKEYPHKWKPSIHMPYEACRMWDEVTEIRCERIHDISESDAVAEGVEQNRDGSWKDYIAPNRLWQDCAKPSYISLWQSINGEESWNVNPWVWVVKFKPTTKPAIEPANRTKK